jgi:hypothetical protein
MIGTGTRVSEAMATALGLTRSHMEDVVRSIRTKMADWRPSVTPERQREAWLAVVREVDVEPDEPERLTATVDAGAGRGPGRKCTVAYPHAHRPMRASSTPPRRNQARTMRRARLHGTSVARIFLAVRAS